MSLQELSDATGIPSSTLGNYEKDENVDMSLGNLLTLADFYQVSTDYLLCRTELREHTNKSVSDLHLNDDAVQILTDEKYNPRLLSEFRKMGRSTPCKSSLPPCVHSRSNTDILEKSVSSDEISPSSLLICRNAAMPLQVLFFRNRSHRKS